MTQTHREGVKKLMRFIMNYEGELVIKKNDVYENGEKIATLSFNDFEIYLHDKK